MPLTEQAENFLRARANTNLPQWHEVAPPRARQLFESLTDHLGEAPAIRRVEDHTIDEMIPIRLFSDCDSPAPAVMYFHGGGWVLGNVRTHDAVCRRIAKTSGCVVIAVDYRLSPEHPFPTPLQDCIRATRYVSDHPEQLGVLPEKLALAGDSAGGNLAAAVALHCRDEGGPTVDLQVLLYPVIEPHFDTPSYLQFSDGFGLTRATMQWFWQQYLGDQIASEMAAPSQAKSLAGLPTTHIITAEYDVLRDEGESFAAKLQRAGVPTTLQRYKGNLHGFVHLAGAFDDGLRATQEIAQAINAHLAPKIT